MSITTELITRWVKGETFSLTHPNDIENFCGLNNGFISTEIMPHEGHELLSSLGVDFNHYSEPFDGDDYNLKIKLSNEAKGLLGALGGHLTSFTLTPTSFSSSFR